MEAIVNIETDDFNFMIAIEGMKNLEKYDLLIKNNFSKAKSIVLIYMGRKETF